MPDQPEALGLVALMLHCEARRAARRTPAGDYLPLSRQDATRWSRSMIEEAEQYLGMAAKGAQIGRFQLEAAIQSVHAQRRQTGQTDWEAIALLYEALVRVAPTVGAMVGRAAAVAEARGAEAGWGMLEAIPPEAIGTYQPYWAVAAHLLKRLRRTSDAKAAYARAIGLCEEPATRAFLIQQSRAV
jgi:RNA polymerase sigma-70 factor (ECF subfamily)